MGAERGERKVRGLGRRKSALKSCLVQRLSKEVRKPVREGAQGVVSGGKEDTPAGS